MSEETVYKQANALVEQSTSFVLSTIDRNGFPYTIIVSAPIIRKGVSLFLFYINGDGRTADNIVRNELGCICCFNEEQHQSLALRGKFRLREVAEVPHLKERLASYQKQLNHSMPVVAEFTTLSLKMHSNLKDQRIEL